MSSATSTPLRVACPRCFGEGFVTGPAGEYAEASLCPVCTPKPNPDLKARDRAACLICRDSGWEPATTPVGPLRRAPLKRCRCQQLPQRIAMFNAARIPARHHACSLKNFIPGANTDLLKHLSDWVKAYDPKEHKTRGFLLYGDVGRGKTHLIVGALRALVMGRGVRVRFVEFSHLLNAMKASFDRHRERDVESASSLVDELVDVDVLAIDELGKGRATEFEKTVIDEPISRRYAAYRTVLCTTNHPPVRKANPATQQEASGGALQPIEGPRSPTANLALGELEPLEDRVGPRVLSRLREVCQFHATNGKDWRITIPYQGA